MVIMNTNMPAGAVPASETATSTPQNRGIRSANE